MANATNFYLGAACSLDGSGLGARLQMPAHHLVTHGIIVGMTGSGKSGLATVMAEEALRNKVPVLIIDVKGDLPNLLLSFPNFDPSWLAPWVDSSASATDERTPNEIAAELASQREKGLGAWGIGKDDLAQFSNSTALRVITPGANAGELLHVFSSLERRSDRWNKDPESARCALSAAISLVLRLVGRDPDPAKSREHVVLSVFAERRLANGQTAELGALLEDLANPPITKIGALSIDAFLPKSDR